MKVTLNSSEVYTGILNQHGLLCNFYAPLFNLQNANTALLGDFTTKELNFDLEHPVDIEILPAYDGAVNLILNDDKNLPRLINTRFSVLDENIFRITDHTGFKDTNIYEEDSFDIDASLKTIAVKIPKVTFNGLTDNGGLMPCGSYSFYFKLADADGNETEILAESGIVLCHIGKTNDPFSIRMGQADENTDKSIKFLISNIDSGFDYVHVYYARKSSSSNSKTVTSYHRINFDYPVLFNGVCNITITGAETIEQITWSELLTTYASIDSVKTQAVSNNVLLFGNVNAPYRDLAKLQLISWKININCYQAEQNSVGTLNPSYEDTKVLDEEYSHCYYNTKNIYYRVGYWPDEVYRFGIVYIFNDNSLSPVLNLQGVDLDLNENISPEDWFEKSTSIDGGDYYTEHLCEPDDFYFNKDKRMNSKGIVHFKNIPAFTCENGIFTPTPIYIKFDFSYIGFDLGKTLNSLKSWKKVLQENDIKGFFFVRLKRIPTILGLGVIIGKTDKDRGALPVLMDFKNKLFYYLSFLKLAEYSEKTHFPTFYPQALTKYLPLLQEISQTVSHSTFLTDGEYKNCVESVEKLICSCNAMLMPEAELQEGIYNDLFCSNKYTLSKVGLITFNNYNIEKTPSVLNFEVLTKDIVDPFVVKLTNVPEDTKLITNGEDYFSTLAGSAAEAYKTSDVLYPWNKTAPLNLTNSTSVVRGQWGAYVGIGIENKETLNYGEVYNVKNENFSTGNGLDICFLQYFLSNEMFFAISDRIAIEDSASVINCYRGDCFPSLYTHRMFRNFIDPELPTNNKIVDPLCWFNNYLVQNTLNPTQKWAGFNFSDNNNSNSFDEIGDNNRKLPKGCIVKMEDKDNKQETFANSLILSFEVCLVDDQQLFKGVFKPGDVKLSTNTELETSPAGAVIKTIVKPTSGAWETHGITSINRADVNAVGLGLWITFPICSSLNLAMRDVDFSNATEEASFNRKRSFYPLSKMDVNNPLRDSNIINLAAKVSIPDKSYINYPNLSYIKQEFHTRIQYSLIDTSNSQTNLFKVLLQDAYVDYPKTLGEIVKLVALNDYVYVICKHGIGLIQVRVDAKPGEDKLTAMAVLSDTYGTMWKDSVVVTDSFIYGVDTIAKKIWQILGTKVNIISDMRVEKFLIDNIDLSELTMKPYIGHINVKTHYNAFKHDVIFTYYNDIPLDVKGNKVLSLYDIEKVTWTDLEPKIDKWVQGKTWSLCWNETMLCFQTFYDWTPVESANIDNIYFSFDKDAANNIISKTKLEILTKNNLFNTGIYVNSHEYDPIKNKLELVYKVFSKNPGSGYLLFNKVAKPGVVYFYIKKLSDACTVSINRNLTIKNSNWNLVYYTLKQVGSTLQINFSCNKANLPLFMVSPVYFLSSDEQFNLTAETYGKYTSETLTFRNDTKSMLLWKHGQAGLYDNLGEIKPTKWYGKQHEFNFEFVVRDNYLALKIFNNLKLISNKVEPSKFEYEIVGEGYEWLPYKPVIQWINNLTLNEYDLYYWYKYVLNTDISKILETHPEFPAPKYKNITRFNKIPYLGIELTDRKGRQDLSYNTEDNWSNLSDENKYSFNSGETVIKYDKLLNEYRVHSELLVNNMSNYGRIRGNALYLEDFWDIEIRPIKFKWLGSYETNIPKKDIIINRNSGSEIAPQSDLDKPSVSEDNIKIVDKNGGYYLQLPTTTYQSSFHIKLPELSTAEKIGYIIFNASSVNPKQRLSITVDGIYAGFFDTKREIVLSVNPDKKQHTIDVCPSFIGSQCFISNIRFLTLTVKTVEARHRDKYLKVKVRYSGTELAVILAILTMFDYSYA